MSMGKDDAPPQQNYALAAQQQGQANIDAARVGSRLSNPNITTPLGSRTVTYGGGAPTFNQSGFDSAMQAYAEGLRNGGGGQSNATFDPSTGWQGVHGGGGAGGGGSNLQAPNQADFWQTTGDPDQANMDIQLSPEQQRLYEGQTALSEGMLGLGQNTLGQVRNSLAGPLDTSGLPNQVSNVQAGPLQTGVQGGQIQGGVDMPGRAGVEDALYSRATARLDPQWQQRTAGVENKLTNQGLRPGTEAWDNAMRNENFAKNDAYSSARNDAILAGGAEQSRQFGLNLGQGQFANTAQGQGFSQGLAGGQFANQAQGQQFNQGLAGGQFQNTARQNALQEALMRRQLPLTEMNAIRTGSQPQMPSFQPYSGSSVQPAPVMQGAQMQGQQDLSAYNAQQAGNSGFMSGLMQLGGTALSGGTMPWWMAG